MNNFFSDMKDRLAELFERLQETALWVDLQDRYQNLSPMAQKATLAGGSFVFAFILLLLPLSYLSSSWSTMSEFQEKRDALRELYRVSREQGGEQAAIPPVSAANMQQQAREHLTNLQLPESQITSVGAIGKAKLNIEPPLPPSLEQAGVEVKLNALNLKQIVEMGNDLQSVHPTAKLVGVDVVASATRPRYFDVTYRVMAFAPPPEPTPPPSDAKGQKKGPKR